MDFKKFTHGILVLNPKITNDDEIPIVQFLGMWEEPTEIDFEILKEELKNDLEFEFYNMVDDLDFILASEEEVKFYNHLLENDNIIITNEMKDDLLDNITLN